MANKGFTHLHLHSQYSLLDGAIAFGQLFEHCKAQGMEAVALTDHGNMFGAVDFYTQAKSAGIKPIIGIETYVAPGSRHDKQKRNGTASDAGYHLVLLAENNAGYKNLLKLSSIGYTEGFYYKPRVDKEVLAQYSDGIIASSACLSGELARNLLNGDAQAARRAALEYVEIFGRDNFFVEIQKHQTDDHPQVRAGLIELADELGLGLLATNDAHFLREDDYEAHNVLCCISTGKMHDDPDRMIYPPDVFVKTPAQMRELFADVPQACDNTMKIAQRCNVELDLSTHHAPVFKPPGGQTPDEYLRKLCYDNAQRLYGTITDEIRQRLERELDVIISKGFASYFLIVWEFCNYATSNGIPVGARGSGVGTVVGYCLGLCNVDPLKYDLLFERFMDPARAEMPDIDIDILQSGRAKVIDYVRQKYGHVAQIITFGTLKARAAIRDVCRVMDVPLAEADRLAKLVPDALGIKLADAMDGEPDLKDAYDSDEKTRKVIDIAMKLEGKVRHASVHAAGVVVADKPLDNFVPLYKAGADDEVTTQFEGPTVEKVGLLKMDFLGLKTLDVIERARKLAQQNHNVEIDIEHIPIDDQEVFKLFGAGMTKGVFQFESGGMQELLMRMKPDRLEDLIAANALYRPGPMSLIPDYIARKHGERWTTPHEIMTEILRETYGIMVYQEQVMRIANRLGDIPLREAYKMIKAISKKKHKIIAAAKEQFIKGCQAKGLSEKQARDIFELIEKFAGYGFNKSHSTRYAFVAYQTAWLKRHYPVEFMAALLTLEMGNTEKVVDYIGEAAAMNIEILPPDINESMVDFTPIYDHHEQKSNAVIRFGLAAVKGVGERAVEQIIKTRKDVGKFQSLYHFCENVDPRAVNKSTIEALIKAGAFDELSGTRAQMVAGLEPAIQAGAKMQSDKVSGQMNFFSAQAANEDYTDDHQRLPQVAPWPEPLMLQYEKAVLGFYVTSNPLAEYAETIDLYSTNNTSDLDSLPDEHPIVIGGMIAKIRNLVTKNGKNAGAKMAVFVLEDPQGSVECVLFPRTFARCAELVEPDKVLFVKGKVDRKREKPNIIVEQLVEPANVHEQVAHSRVQLVMDSAGVNKEIIERIKAICRHHKGGSAVCLTIRTARGRVHTEAARQFSVKADLAFCREIRQVVGKKNLKLNGSVAQPGNGRKRRA